MLRMPFEPHEFCIGNIVDEILDQVRQYRTGNGSSRRQAFAEQIAFTAAPTLRLSAGNQGVAKELTPDATFWHERSHWPGVVIEIAASQRMKNLDRRASDFICRSKGGIQVVVCLKLNDRNQGANLTVWRRRITTADDGITDLHCIKEVYKASLYLLEIFICLPRQGIGRSRWYSKQRRER